MTKGEIQYFEKAKNSILEILKKLKVSNIIINYNKKLDHIKGTKLRRIKNEFKNSN